MPAIERRSIEFVVYESDEHGPTWGFRTLGAHGESTTSFDLTDPVAQLTFATSMLNFGSELVHDAIAKLIEERTTGEVLPLPGRDGTR